MTLSINMNQIGLTLLNSIESLPKWNRYNATPYNVMLHIVSVMVLIADSRILSSPQVAINGINARCDVFMTAHPNPQRDARIE